jgi:hypothetical protein
VAAVLVARCKMIMLDDFLMPELQHVVALNRAAPQPARHEQLTGSDGREFPGAIAPEPQVFGLIAPRRAQR